jgi:hypothetical protein
VGPKGMQLTGAGNVGGMAFAEGNAFGKNFGANVGGAAAGGAQTGVTWGPEGLGGNIAGGGKVSKGAGLYVI